MPKHKKHNVRQYFLFNINKTVSICQCKIELIEVEEKNYDILDPDNIEDKVLKTEICL